MIHVLTGAGFSANVGTPIASEVSSRVFSLLNGNGNQNAAELIVLKGGFEQACIGLDRTDPTLLAIKEAVVEVFRHVDEVDKRISPENTPTRFLDSCMRHMMRLLALVESDGCVFTTNFDMLVERYLWYANAGNFILERPYYIDAGVWFRKNGASANRTDVACKVELGRNVPSGQQYYKLHGSIDWTDSGQTPVIGFTKKEDILSHSVLNRYWQQFDSKLTASGAKLLVVGYGFGDEFVNEVLVRGVSVGDLKIFVWDVLSLRDMIAKLRSVDERLASAVVGYCGQSIFDRFPVTGIGGILDTCPDLKSFVR